MSGLSSLTWYRLEDIRAMLAWTGLVSADVFVPITVTLLFSSHEETGGMMLMMEVFHNVFNG